jgi:hypothetical protein
VKITYSLSKEKYICGTGIQNDANNRKIPIINIIKIENI